MDPVASISGIASGVQWRDMIDQIMRLEARPVNMLQERITLTQSRMDAWSQFRTLVKGFNEAAMALRDGSAFTARRVQVSGQPAGQPAPVDATAVAGAPPVSVQLEVLGLATRERVSGHVFQARDSALGLEGQFVVNGVAVRIAASDTLEDVVAGINQGQAGVGVTASILSTGPDAHRLVVTSDSSGAAGIRLADADGTGVLRQLGLLDDSAGQLREPTSSGARGWDFSDAVTTVGQLLGLEGGPSGTVRIGGVDVALDLATDSLQDVATAINLAMSQEGRSITADVTQVTVDGQERRQLVVTGTTSLDDQGTRILETLGLLEGGRSAVAQQLTSGSQFTWDGVEPATAGTRFDQLRLDGNLTGVEQGDTLTISGVDHQGNSVSTTFTIGDEPGQDGAELGHLVDHLNEVFSAADPSGATASIQDGRLVFTANTSGESQLALHVTANNEGGGTLDFGDLSTSTETVGRSRVITAGVDAVLEVEGTRITSSSNTVSDAIAGVDIQLRSVSTQPVTLTVSADTGNAADAVQGLVDAYNRIGDFIAKQSERPADGEPSQPLAGETMLRAMRSQLADVLRTTIAPDVSGSVTRLADIGVEVDRYGQYTFQRDSLEAALETDAEAVARLFGVFGQTEGASLSYLSSGDEARSGTYQVEITAAATRGTATGSGFDGAYQYADPGTQTDRLVITDIGSLRSYAINLLEGMTTAEMVDALNVEFGTALQHEMAAGNVLYGDDGVTPAGEGTAWSAVRLEGGEPLEVTAGTTFEISGRRPDAESFLVSYSVAEGDTVGHLVAAVQDAVGVGVEVKLEDGRLLVRDESIGRSLLDLAISARSSEGEPIQVLGGVDVTVEGRDVADMTAEVVYDGLDQPQLRVTHGEYGSGAGFTVGFDGDQVNAAQLGLVLDEPVAGTDVVGMIGGQEASGSGQYLTGGANSDAESIRILYTGAAAGNVGSVIFSRGVGSAAELAAAPLLGRDAGSISGIVERLGDSTTTQQRRIENAEQRLERRRETLIRRFTLMEKAMAQAQSQLTWLTAQLSQLNSNSRYGR